MKQTRIIKTRQMLLHVGASLSPFVAINAFLFLYVMLIANGINVCML